MNGMEQLELFAMTTKKRQAPTSLRRADASKYLREKYQLRYSPHSMATMACHSEGPSYTKVGRLVFYPIHLLDEWAEQRLSPTVTDINDLWPKRKPKAPRPAA